MQLRDFEGLKALTCGASLAMVLLASGCHRARSPHVWAEQMAVARPPTTKITTVESPAPKTTTDAADSETRIPAEPQPFGLLAELRLGMNRSEVAAISEKLASGEYAYDKRARGFQVSFQRDRVTKLHVIFSGDRYEDELIALWGKPQPGPDDDVVWLTSTTGQRARLHRRELIFERYTPETELLGTPESEGLVHWLLKQTKEAIGAAYPNATAIGDERMDLAFPPLPTDKNDIRVRVELDRQSKVVAVELSANELAEDQILRALESRYGSPEIIDPCQNPKKKTRSCATEVDNMFLISPLTYFSRKAPEVTAWRDLGQLYVRFANKASKPSHFRTFTMPK